MNAAHWHLILNHVPVIGLGLAIFAIGWALLRTSPDLRKFGLLVLVVVGLSAVPAYLTGEPAEGAVEHLPGISKPLVESHEEAAKIAFASLSALGVLAIVGLVFFRGERIVPRWFGGTTLLLAVVVAGLMGWTANLGGGIRHPEIRGSGAAPGESSHHFNHKD